MRIAHLWLTTALWVVGCGSGAIGDHADGGGTDLSTLTSVDVMPADATLDLVNDQPVMQTYTAIGHFSDGHTEDITSQTSFVIDNLGLGSFIHNQFTSYVRNGGKGTIKAFAGDRTGIATLTLVLHESYVDPQAGTLPQNPGSAFGGSPSTTNKPDVVYPANNVLLPPNLGKIEVHWLPGAGNTIFELSFQSTTTDVKIYTTCVNPTNGGCIYLPEPKVWTWLAESNRGGGAGLSIRGVASPGSGVGSSTALNMAFSQDDLSGGMYYWTTPKNEPNDQAARIYRWDFGSTTQTAPEEVVTPAQTGDHCVGCHAVSPDGRRLFVTSEGSYDAFVLLRDLKTGQPIKPWNSTDPVAFASWEYPDGARFVGTFADKNQTGFRSFDLNLYNGADGSFMSSIPGGGTDANRSAHPDWSPDGSMIAFTRLGGNTDGANDAGTSVRGYRSRLRMVTKQGTGWSAPIDLTPTEEGKSNYYPAFSPQDPAQDSYTPTALILYNRSSCADGHDSDQCDMYDDPNSSLWIMKPQAGATPIELVIANAPTKTDAGRDFVENSFPKWTPFTFRRTVELGKRLFWFTFSSDRSYGLRSPAPGAVLIWMAGIDPDATLSGYDGSFPPFLLPFQDITRDNHTAQWTRKVVVIP